MFQGKVYRDGIDLSVEQAYKFLDENPDDWATSAPSPGDFLAAYKKAAEKGAKEIICIAPPPKISATWNSALNAKKIAESEMPGIKIEVIDVGTLAAGEALLVKELAEGIEQGKNFEELIKMAEYLREKVRLFIVPENIRHVYRSGRIPEIASKIGSLLPLKPILGAHGGKLHIKGATMSKEKSGEKVLTILKNELNPNLTEVVLTHIDSPEEIEELREKVASLIPNAKISIREFSPILGYALGRKAIGIAFFVK